MLVAITISLLYQTANSHLVPVTNTINYGLVKCVRDIVTEYFAEHKELTYVKTTENQDEILKTIHALNVVTVISKSIDQKLTAFHQGYFVSASNSNFFVEHFQLLTKEATWNPGARFLILVETLEDSELEHIFNELLRLHVNNVLVVNGTEDAQLYTYNPYDNYGCGKRYEDIISYGTCSQTRTYNLYPNKFVTGLRNCTFDVWVRHWPPYSVIPTNDTNKISDLSYGIEPYFFKLIGYMSGFTVNNVLKNRKKEEFSAVNSDMKASGVFELLQNNEIDVILGGYLLLPSRGNAFSYIHDFLPYEEEVRFIVHRADFASAWKYVYLEFDVTVWILIAFSVILYSAVMMLVLGAQDKSTLVLKLVGNLLLHGCKVYCQSTVKWMFIAWVWFAYLINTFYQSSLVSLTTNPVREKQISTESEILQHNLKPCITDLMLKFSTEPTELQQSYIADAECKTLYNATKAVMKHKEYYSVILYSLYMYNIQHYRDRYGTPQIYSLKKPHSKAIYCMYLHKGFPLINELHSNALRVREVGLVHKAKSDLYYLNAIKNNFHAKEYKTRFVMPWSVYAVGCTIAGVIFIIELISVRK